MNPNRIIGKYTGDLPGPLLICLAGIHGNEPAGIQALEHIFHVIELEPQSNPGFKFRGSILGLRGNLQALDLRERFVANDLNRMWTEEAIVSLRQQTPENLAAEDLELRELADVIDREIANIAPDSVVFLDLHTTSADGGIFTVPSDDPESLRIGIELHAPVIKGMLEGIKGSTLNYFVDGRIEVPCVAVAFEAGQHNDPLSVNRCIAAITNCLRSIGCVQAENVENRHDKLLRDYARGLPRVAEVVHHHPISPGDKFKMEPGYKNFQPVTKGELLATDQNGPIHAPMDALMLMPHYQKRGNDGFFLIRES